MFTTTWTLLYKGNFGIFMIHQGESEGCWTGTKWFFSTNQDGAGWRNDDDWSHWKSTRGWLQVTYNQVISMEYIRKLSVVVWRLGISKREMKIGLQVNVYLPTSQVQDFCYYISSIWFILEWVGEEIPGNDGAYWAASLVSYPTLLFSGKYEWWWCSGKKCNDIVDNDIDLLTVYWTGQCWGRASSTDLDRFRRPNNLHISAGVQRRHQHAKLHRPRCHDRRWWQTVDGVWRRQDLGDRTGSSVRKTDWGQLVGGWWPDIPLPGKRSR